MKQYKIIVEKHPVPMTKGVKSLLGSLAISDTTIRIVILTLFLK